MCGPLLLPFSGVPPPAAFVPSNQNKAPCESLALSETPHPPCVRARNPYQRDAFKSRNTRIILTPKWSYCQDGSCGFPCPVSAMAFFHCSLPHLKEELLNFAGIPFVFYLPKWSYLIKSKLNLIAEVIN